MKKTIFFVDDDPKLLEGFKRMLRGMRKEWEMKFIGNGPEALEVLQKEQCHVLVTDMRMPGMDGLELLSRVRDLYPHVVRIILSGYSDQDLVLKSLGPAHQYLSKSCDADTLKATVSRACAMRTLLEDEALVNVISCIESLPSLPSLYTEVVNEVNSPNSSLSKVGEIVSKDVGMSAKILQLANSPIFGLPGHITIPAKAVLLLGLETIKSLILSVKIFSRFEQAEVQGFSINGLWDHSIATGIIARSLATQHDLEQKKIDEAFMAGLLHDVGKLILLDRFPEKCREILRAQNSCKCRSWEAESHVIGTTHAHVGAYLLGIWGLSEEIVEAIAFHHSPRQCPNKTFNILTTVHLADGLEHEENTALGLYEERLDNEYLDTLGIGGRGDEWRNGPDDSQPEGAGAGI